MATYATTKFDYAAVIAEWAKSLLIRAKEKNLHLVFMARDGIPAYNAAKALTKKFPEYAEVPINLIYLSRSIVNNSNEDVLKQYLTQEGITKDVVDEGKTFLFLDVGFAGSMNGKLRDVLEANGIPSDPKLESNAVNFEYLISTGNKGRGYAIDRYDNHDIQAVASAGKHRGIYWLEDTHQGEIESPTALKEIDGKLIPNTIHDQIDCRSRNELDFLCKKIAQEAFNDYNYSIQEMDINRNNTHSRQPLWMRNLFSSHLLNMKNDRFLYVDHK